MEVRVMERFETVRKAFPREGAKEAKYFLEGFPLRRLRLLRGTMELAAA